MTNINSKQMSAESVFVYKIAKKKKVKNALQQ